MQRLPLNAWLLLISITSCARAVQLGGQFTNQSAPSLLQALGKVGPAVQELFTTNAVCSKSNCINPVFPGLEDLHTLAHSAWTCTSLAKIKESMQFCQPVIDYDPALQAGSGQTIDELALKQDGLLHLHFSTTYLAWDTMLGTTPNQGSQVMIASKLCGAWLASRTSPELRWAASMAIRAYTYDRVKAHARTTSASVELRAATRVCSAFSHIR